MHRQFETRIRLAQNFGLFGTASCVTSRNTSTTPSTSPRSSTIGEPLSSIEISRPSRASSSV
jgi:hypothetical protein